MKPQIVARYVETGKVRIVWNNLAWIGADSRRAAEASACAHEQGKFWAYHDKLYGNQRGYNNNHFSAERLNSFAAELGLDTERFAGCLASQRYAGTVAAELQAARGLGISATPTFFVNGHKVMGAQSVDRWVQIIEALLKEKGS